MKDAQQLYQKIIINHAKYPNQFKVLSEYNFCEKLRNPDCGDDLQVYAQIKNQQLIDLSFTGNGCMISMASTSMMVENLHNQSLESVRAQIQNFQNLILGHEYDGSKLGDLMAFETLNQFPTRVRCAMLPWHVMINILEDADGKKK